MARYIDADRIISEFTSNGGIFVYGIDTVKAIISRVNVQPTADVVPVVRCKDCKYCRKPKGKERYAYFEGVLLCESYEMNDSDVCAVNPDDFCSYGERRCSG
jgi:hypothetical protein